MDACILTAAVAAVAVLTGGGGCRNKIAGQDEVLDIRLVTDDPSMDFYPGAEIPLNAIIQNEGTIPAHIFIVFTVPTATGAVLGDGTEDPEVFLYEIGEDWTEVEEGVYYGGIVPAGEESPVFVDSFTIPNYRIRNGGCGDLTLEELLEMTNQYHMQAYAIQAEGLENTDPERLWEMIGAV